MGDNTLSKVVAVLIVVLFLGMIFSSAFQGGGEPSISVENFGLIGPSRQDGEAILYLKMSNNKQEPNTASINLKLNGEEINSTQVSFSANETGKELKFDIRFQYPSDQLLFTIKDKEGETIGTVERAIANYPQIPS